MLDRDASGASPAEIPVLFLHGLGGSADSWDRLLRRGGERRLAVDLPGHGGSDELGEEAWSVQGLADCAAAVLDTLAMRRVLVVGHALGGAAALKLASGRPSRVAGLLLLDPAPDSSGMTDSQRRSLVESFARDPAAELEWYYRQYLEGAAPGVADAVLGDLGKARATALLGGLRASLEWSPGAELEKWAGPVRLLLSPLQDEPGSLHRTHTLEAFRLDRGSHWTMLDQPEAVERHLAELRAELPVP